MTRSLDVHDSSSYFMVSKYPDAAVALFKPSGSITHTTISRIERTDISKEKVTMTRRERLHTAHARSVMTTLQEREGDML